MGKRTLNQQKSIEESMDILQSYSDEDFDAVYSLLFDYLLRNTKYVPFRKIINKLDGTNGVYRDKPIVHGLLWCYTADKRIINGWDIYSFRFPNLCEWELYDTINLKSSLFRKSRFRHHSDYWYSYTGKHLPNDIAKYLSIPRIFPVDDSPKTLLFFNKEENRMDIDFFIPSINKKITITFENGTPER